MMRRRVDWVERIGTAIVVLTGFIALSYALGRLATAGQRPGPAHAAGK